MRKRRFGCGLALVVLLSTLVIYEVVLPSRNPLRQSKETIEASLLEQTPLGSTRQEVHAFLQREGLTFGEFSQEVTEQEGITLQSLLGKYTDCYLVRYAIFANWVFDKDDRLQKIEVRKVCLDCL